MKNAEVRQGLINVMTQLVLAHNQRHGDHMPLEDREMMQAIISDQFPKLKIEDYTIIPVLEYALYEGEMDTERKDVTGKIVVLRPSCLAPPFRHKHNQLFLAQGGFGCHPDKMGSAVFGQHLSDGERTRVERGDILGTITPEQATEALGHPWDQKINEEIETQGD